MKTSNIIVFIRHGNSIENVQILLIYKFYTLTVQGQCHRKVSSDVGFED